MPEPILRSLAKALSDCSEPQQTQHAVDAAWTKIQNFDQKHRGFAADLLGLDRTQIEAIAPCTALQEGMISRSLNSDPEGRYFSTFRFTLSDMIDLQDLRRAWQRCSERLQILRTRFVRTNDGYAQIVLKEACVPFDIRKVQAEMTLDELIGRQWRQWLDKNDPHLMHPMEISIFLAKDRKVMCLNIFHGLYDGNCLGRLLLHAYNACAGEDVITVQPSFHAVLPYGPLLEPKDAKQFWSAHLKNLKKSTLILAGPPDEQTSIIRLDHSFETRRRSLNVTHQALIQAAWIATMTSVTRKREFLTGLVCSGRSIEWEGADEVIGPMFNTIPFRALLNNETTWKSLVQDCHDFNVRSLPYQHTSLRSIQKWCRQSSKSDLFDALFIFQVEQPENNAGFSNEFWTLENQRSFSDYPLTIDAEFRKDGSLSVVLASTGSKINGHSLASMLQEIEVGLRRILTNSEAVVGFSDTISGAEANGATSEHEEFRTNGHTNSKFSWSGSARAIRTEISLLSGVDEEDITEQTSIFELGLDSIDAIKLSSRLTGHGFKLPVSSIMQAATITQMLQRNCPHNETSKATNQFEQVKATLAKSFLTADPSWPRDAIVLPATPLQEAMVSEMIASQYRKYFNHDVLRLAEKVDESRLRTAWKLVFDRTPILRTSFKSVDDPKLRFSYAQVVDKKASLPWQSVAVNDEKDVAGLMEHIRSLATETEHPETLLKLTMIHVKEDRFLLLSVSHALYDGYSLGLIHQQVREAYHTGQVADRPSYEPLLADIVEIQESDFASAFWSGHLSGIKPCLLEDVRLDCTTSASLDGPIRSEIRSKTPSTDVRTFCKAQGITAQTLGQACFALVLASYVCRLDVVFGLVLSGRDTEEAHRTIFPTMNTVAFRANIQGTKSDFLRGVQTVMADVRRHQHFPLHRAQKYADTAAGKLFDTLFIYQSLPQAEDDFQQLFGSVGGFSDVEVPACVEMELDDEHVVWRAACHQNLFDTQDTRQLLQRMEFALTHLMHDPGALLQGRAEKVVIGDLPPFTIRQESVNLANGHENIDDLLVPRNSDCITSPDLEAVQDVIALVSQVPNNEVTPDTTLYHLGLDSISAIKVCSLLKKRGLIISVSALLRASTIVGIAKAVIRSDGSTHSLDESVQSSERLIASVTEEAQSLAGTDDGNPSWADLWMPATAGQIYMLNHWKQSRGRLFFDTFYFDVETQRLTPEALRHAVFIWIGNRQVLRTTFVQTSSSRMPFIQKVLRPQDLQARCKRNLQQKTGKIVLESSSATDAGAEENTFATSISYEALGGGRWKIGVKIHHALYDGVSLPLLLSDLETLIGDSDAKLSPDGLDTFASFAAQTFNDAQTSHAMEFWTQYLGRRADNVQAVQPTHHPLSDDLHSTRLALYRPGYMSDAKSLIKKARGHGVTLPAIFLAALGRLIHGITRKFAQPRSSNTSHVVIGVYIANRSRDSASLAHYPTVNLLPVVIDISVALMDAAIQIQKDLVEISAAPNVAVSLDQIEHWTGVRLDTFVNWIQLPDEGNENGGDLKDEFRLRNEMDNKIEDEADEFTLPTSFKALSSGSAYQVSFTRSSAASSLSNGH